MNSSVRRLRIAAQIDALGRRARADCLMLDYPTKQTGSARSVCGVMLHLPGLGSHEGAKPRRFFIFFVILGHCVGLAFFRSLVLVHTKVRRLLCKNPFVSSCEPSIRNYSKFSMPL
jgi:hypothetical protein